MSLYNNLESRRARACVGSTTRRQTHSTVILIIYLLLWYYTSLYVSLYYCYYYSIAAAADDDVFEKFKKRALARLSLRQTDADRIRMILLGPYT